MSRATEARLRATVVYCARDRQWTVGVEVPAGSTLRDAVVASGLPQQVPGLDPAALDLGVFNDLREPDEPVRDGDRIEVYRPLAIDPKEARRIRAEIRRRRKG
jgi:putative ubiquitin-RnfH superfamily antitoxin RatB of RatAB toxin-antitoxin module